MANLELNRQLRIKYDNASSNKNPLFENLNIQDPDLIEKALNDSVLKFLDGDYRKYFVEGEYARVYLVFIDVCKFSSRYGHLNGRQISMYFDDYYDIVIPIIYEYGGVIDKIMGDGLVVVFGEPFLDVSVDDCFNRVDQCSRKIIAATSSVNSGRYSSKIAIVYGKVSYYKNKSLYYHEYTIVGAPLIQLFRLETVAVDESICFFQNQILQIFMAVN